MKLFQVIAAAIVIAITTACTFGMGTYVDGSIGCEGRGFARSPVYVFTKKQVGETIHLVSKENSRLSVDEVFRHLPFDKCVALTRTDNYGGSFKLVIPSYGDFVIAVDGHLYAPRNFRNGRWYHYYGGSFCYWLYGVTTDGRFYQKVELSEYNTVSANVPGQISLPAPDSYPDTEHSYPGTRP